MNELSRTVRQELLERRIELERRRKEAYNLLCGTNDALYSKRIDLENAAKTQAARQLASSPEMAARDAAQAAYQNAAKELNGACPYLPGEVWRPVKSWCGLPVRTLYLVTAQRPDGGAWSQRIRADYRLGAQHMLSAGWFDSGYIELVDVEEEFGVDSRIGRLVAQFLARRIVSGKV